MFFLDEILDNFRSEAFIFSHEKSHEKFVFKSDGPHPELTFFTKLPKLSPSDLGDQHFRRIHQVDYNYVGGDMARGISSVELVIELGKLGCLGFFGAAGLRVSEIEKAILKIKAELDPLGRSFGSNIIHTPANPSLEMEIAELYLSLGVKRVSAAAFMGATKSLVFYACKGLKEVNGEIQRGQFLFPKISRLEVAKHFMSPASEKLLSELFSEGKLTREECDLARKIPLAEDITVEADSAGHTDGRPLLPLFTTIFNLGHDLCREHHFTHEFRIGAAGGVATPQGIAAAFALGASYVLVGSVHQAAIESGQSLQVKKLLAKALTTDVITTLSADMFEIGGKVQVLKAGNLMGLRGNELYTLYLKHGSIDDIPPEKRAFLEKNIFRFSLDEIWEKTVRYFDEHEPQEIVRANSNPKYKMALIFRWYLGNTSRWAMEGEPSRIMDYQIWCGPAMGAFNDWVRGSFLEDPVERSIRQIVLNEMEGATRLTRGLQLRSFGVLVPHKCLQYKPRRL